jgi:hypothetical protein
MNFTIWVFQTSALWPGLACQWPTPPGTVAGAHPSAPTLPYLSGYAPARRASSTVGLGPCRPTTASGPSPTPDVWRRLKGNQAPLSPPFFPSAPAPLQVGRQTTVPHVGVKAAAAASTPFTMSSHLRPSSSSVIDPSSFPVPPSCYRTHRSSSLATGARLPPHRPDSVLTVDSPLR